MSQVILHKHIVVRAVGNSYLSESLENEQFINKSIEKLIHDINMKVILPARSHYVSALDNAGYTGNAGLETSHFAYHLWDSRKLLQVDLYTCGCLGVPEIEKVLTWMEGLIGKLERIDILVLDRNLGIEVLVNLKKVESKERAVMLLEFNKDGLQ